MDAIPQFRSRFLCPELAFWRKEIDRHAILLGKRNAAIHSTQIGQRIVNIAVVVHLQWTHSAVIDGRHLAKPTTLLQLGLNMGWNIQWTETNEIFILNTAQYTK